MLSSMNLYAIAGKLHMVEGEVLGETAVPGILSQPAPSKANRSRENDTLFVHLALTGIPEDTVELTQDLLDIFSQRYYAHPGSVTASLRQALNHINQKLLNYNLSLDQPPREGAISCAVLRNGELFMIQTGESLALLGHNFGVERLPAHVPERITPLGRSAGLDFRYSHHRLQSGDLLLLADPRISHLPSHALAPALVDTEVELGIEELKNIVGEDSARLLLIEFTDSIPADLPDVAQPITRSRRMSLPRRSLDKKSAARASVPISQTNLPQRPIRESDIGSEGLTLPTPNMGEMSTAVETTARRAAAQTAMGVSFFSGWLAELLTRLRPKPKEEPDETQNNTILPTILAILIPIIVVLTVTTVYLQRGRIKRMGEIKQEMAQAISLADEAGDNVELARQHYNVLFALAAEAESLRPGDENVASMRRRALSALDHIDGVTRLTARPLFVYGEEVGLTAVALREGFNGDIYTLDGNSGSVYEHITDEFYLTLETEEPKIIATKNQAVGTHIIGNIHDIKWRPRGQAVSREGLAMLDRRGALLTYYPNWADTRAVPLGLGSDWQEPNAITFFSERLYILDKGTQLIWKYFPDGDGFIVDNEEKTLALDDNANLGQAQDIDIYSEDGSLIVAYQDGQLRYYDTRSSRIQWDEQDLLQNGLTTPLIAPTAAKLVGQGLNASLFIIDAGSGRLIEVSRGGTLLAQYRAADELGQEIFTNATDFVVVKTPLRIFVTVGNTLYAVTQE